MRAFAHQETKDQSYYARSNILHCSFFQKTGENFSFCVVPSVGYIKTLCFVICSVSINKFFIFNALISFSKFLTWPRTWKFDAKTIKMGSFLTSWLYSSLIKISVAFETDIIRISSHFKQLPFAF